MASILGCVGVILLCGLILKVNHIQLNLTSSMPIGFYQKLSRSVIQRSDIVAVCLPQEIAKEGVRRGYLQLLEKDICPDHVIPVIKQVIAIPHDQVFLTRDAIVVNGVSYPAPQSLVDSQHHEVKRFVANGFYKDVSNYWLYGFNDPKKSWDSRYFGGVGGGGVLGVYREVWVLRR